jgi:hypothetical protein
MHKMAHEVRIEAFYGYHAPVAQQPPKQMSERETRVFALACSERLHGRKKILSTNGPFDAALILCKEAWNALY